jgi:hypothetical protein
MMKLFIAQNECPSESRVCRIGLENQQVLGVRLAQWAVYFESPYFCSARASALRISARSSSSKSDAWICILSP